MNKRNWVSNRFKTEENRQWHTAAQFQAMHMVDQSAKEHIEKTYGLQVEVLSQHILRITDGKKKLDLYKDRYFKVDTKERGDYNYSNRDELIEEYFNIKPINPQSANQ